MSVVCVITPVIIASWPLFSSIAAAAGAKLGLKLIENDNIEKNKLIEKDLELVEEESQILKEMLKGEEEMVLKKDDILITLKKDERDKIKICINGNRKKEELKKIAKEFSNKIKQQFAYFKVKEEMKKKGYSLVQEEFESGRIKLVLRKY